MWWWFGSAALAVQGDTLVEDREEVDAAGATALAVRDVRGAVEVVGDDGSTVRATATCSTGEVTLSLVRKGDVVTLTAKEHGADDLKVRVSVPKELASLTVGGVVGPTSTRDLPAAIAVVGVTGPVDLSGAGSVRAQNVTGPLTVERVGGDVLADGIVGPVDVTDTEGRVRLYGVIGPVEVARVGGDLLVEGGLPVVHHEGVRGAVTVP